MNIRYFYVKDLVTKKLIKIQYCGTGDMLADYFTKPLQGKLFQRMRDHIMNIDPSNFYHSDHRSVLSTENNDRTEEDCKDVTVESADVGRKNDLSASRLSSHLKPEKKITL